MLNEKYDSMYFVNKQSLDETTSDYFFLIALLATKVTWVLYILNTTNNINIRHV